MLEKLFCEVFACRPTVHVCFIPTTGIAKVIIIIKSHEVFIIYTNYFQLNL